MADTKISGLTAVASPAAGDQYAVVNGGVSKVITATQIYSLMVRKQSQGSSTSGTSGTAVCSVTCAASTKLFGWSVCAAQTATTATQLTVTVTYSDATTISSTTGAASASMIVGNDGGLERLVAGAHVAVVTGSAKDVTSVAVTTAGTGTGTRSGVIAGIQIPA